MVAWSSRMTWPDCSPPSAKPCSFIASSTYRSPTEVSTRSMPSRAIASLKPRLDITVATAVLRRSVPASFMATARIAMIWSPSTSSPAASAARQRSASPSRAMPRSAECSRMTVRSRSRWVEPTPSLMLRPVGSAPRVCTTSAPARAKASGATYAAAPCAPSMTTRMPSRRLGSTPMRCATYLSKPSVYSRTRPTAAPVGRFQSSPPAACLWKCASMASSMRSSSLWPPRARNLMPLSGMALWLADSITPKSAPSAPVR